MDINNLGMASFQYLMYSTNDGKPRASTNVFYGPWDSAEQFYEMLNNYFQNIKPEGSIVAIQETSTNSRGKEIVDNVDLYIYYNGALHEFGGNGESEYIKTIFAFKQSVNTPERPTSISTLSSEGWSTNVPNSQPFWMSFAYYLIKDGNAILCDYSGQTTNATWSLPFEIGGGNGTIPTTIGQFSYNLSPDGISIPVKKTGNNYITTNKALKESTRTKITAYYDGQFIDFTNGGSFALVQDDSSNNTISQLGLKLEKNQDYFWLSSSASNADNYEINLGTNPSLGPVILLASMNASPINNGLIIQSYTFAESEESYKIECIPGIVVFDEYGDTTSSVDINVTKINFLGETENISISQNGNYSLKITSRPNTQNAEEIIVSSEPIQQETFENLRANAEAKTGDVFKIELYDNNTRNVISGAYDFLPIVSLARIAQSNGVITVGLINDSVTIPSYLTGDSLSSAYLNQLKEKTIASLNISVSTNDVSLEYYKILGLTNSGQLTWNKGGTNQKNGFDYELESGSNPHSCWLTQIDEDSLSAIAIHYEYKLSNEDNPRYGVEAQNVEFNHSYVSYELKAFPDTAWLVSTGDAWQTQDLNLYIKQFTETGITRIDGDGGIIPQSLSFKYTGIYSSQQSSSQPITVPISTRDSFSFNLSNSNISLNNLVGINIQLLKNSVVEDYEYIDVVKMPASGSSESGESPYQLQIIKNSLVLIDDDSPNSNIEEASVTKFQLMHGNTRVQNFVVQPVKVNENDNTAIVQFNTESVGSVSIPQLNVVQDGNNTNQFKLQLNNQNQTFNEIYPLDGSVVYKVTSIDGNDVTSLNIIAEQKVLVRNFSNGEIYTLDLYPSVLYKDQYSNLMSSSSDTTVTAKLNIINHSQITTPSLNEFSIRVYENTINDSANGGTRKQTINFANNSDSCVIDFSQNPYATTNCPNCYIVALMLGNTQLDVQTVYFSIKGADGVVVDNNMIVSINNDAIIIDNDTDSADLQTASQTTVSYNFAGEDITTDVNGSNSGVENSITNLSNKGLYNVITGYTISSNNNSLISVSHTDNQYQCSWVSDSLPKEQKTLQVIYWIKWDDTEGTVRGQGETERTHMASKTQVIQIKDFSNGAVYKLSATPNTIAYNPNTEEYSEDSQIIANVIQIYKKTVTQTNVQTITNGGDVSLCIYPLKNTANKVYSNMPSGVNTQSEWPKVDNNNYRVYQNLVDNKVGISLSQLANEHYFNDENFLINGLQIEAIIWNGSTPIVVDSETIQIVTGGEDGQQGATGEDCYLLSLDNDNVYIDDNLDDGSLADKDGTLKLLSLCHPILKKGVNTIDNYTTVDQNQICNVKYVFTWMNDFGQNGCPFDIYVNHTQNSNVDTPYDSTSNQCIDNFYLKLANAAQDLIQNDDQYKLNVAAYIKIGEDTNGNLIFSNNPVDTETYTIKVVNVSEDGSSYRLVLNNDKLYRDHDGLNLGAGFDNTVTAKLLKVTGSEQFQYQEFNWNVDPLSNNANPGLYVFATAYYKSGDPDYSYDLVNDPFNIEASAQAITQSLTFDCQSFRAATNANNGCVKIVIGAYYKQSNGDLITIDEETVSFVLKGEQGDPGVAGFYINMTNDSATIDNNSPKSVIEFATENKIQLYYNNVIVPITDYTLSTKFIDFESKEDGWTITKGSVNDVADQKITFVKTTNEDQLILSQNSSTVDNSYIVNLTNNNEQTYTTVQMPTGTAMVQYTFTVNASVAGTQNSVVLTKIQSIKIDEISEDGSIYRLMADNDKLDVYYDGDNYAWLSGTQFHTPIKFTAIKYNEDGEENVQFSNVVDNDITNATNYIKLYAVCDEGYVWYKNLGYSDSSDRTYIDYDRFLMRGSNYGQTITNIRKYFVELYVNNKKLDTEVIDFSVQNKAFEYVIEANPSAIKIDDDTRANQTTVSKTINFSFKKHIYNDDNYSSYSSRYKINIIGSDCSTRDTVSLNANAESVTSYKLTKNIAWNDLYIEAFMYKSSDITLSKPIATKIVPINTPGPQGPQGPQGLRGLTLQPYYLDYYGDNKFPTLNPNMLYEFKNDLDNPNVTNETNRVLSFLLVPESKQKKSYTAYRCVTPHTCAVGNTSYTGDINLVVTSNGASSWDSYLNSTINNVQYWTTKGVQNLGDTYINNLLATNAYIDNLVTNKIKTADLDAQNIEIKDSLGNTVGGFTSNPTDGYPLWLGGSTGTNATFKVNWNGYVDCSNATFTNPTILYTDLQLGLRQLRCAYVNGNDKEISDLPSTIQAIIQGETLGHSESMKIYYLDPTEYGSTSITLIDDDTESVSERHLFIDFPAYYAGDISNNKYKEMTTSSDIASYMRYASSFLGVTKRVRFSPTQATNICLHWRGIVSAYAYNTQNNQISDIQSRWILSSLGNENFGNNDNGIISEYAGVKIQQTNSINEWSFYRHAANQYIHRFLPIDSQRSITNNFQYIQGVDILSWDMLTLTNQTTYAFDVQFVCKALTASDFIDSDSQTISHSSVDGFYWILQYYSESSSASNATPVNPIRDFYNS